MCNHPLVTRLIFCDVVTPRVLSSAITVTATVGRANPVTLDPDPHQLFKQPERQTKKTRRQVTAKCANCYGGEVEGTRWRLKPLVNVSKVEAAETSAGRGV